MLALIVWTGSRAYLAAAFGTALLGTILVARHLRFPAIKFAFVAVSGLALIVTGILLVEPRRFTGSYLTHISHDLTGTPTPTHQTPPEMNWFQRFSRGIIPTIEEDVRTPSTRYYSKLLSANYLGVGLNFESRFTAYHPPSRTYQGPNTILDLPLYGGIGGVLSVAYLAFLIARRTAQRLTQAVDENPRYAIGAVTALGGLWGAAFLVGSPLFDYQFWILTAIALA